MNEARKWWNYDMMHVMKVMHMLKLKKQDNDGHNANIEIDKK